MSLVVALLLFGFTKPDQTYFIQYRPPLNKALHYDIETTMKGGTSGSLKISKTVKAVKFEGRNFTVVTTFDSVQLGIGQSEAMAQAERFVKETVVTQVIDSEGHIVSSDVSRGVASLLSGGLDAVDALAFSPSPVKVGDTWRTSVDTNGGKVEADIKLERVSTDRGKQVAHLQLLTASAPVHGAEAWIAVDVEIATGVLLRLEMMSKASAKKGKEPEMHVLIRLK